MNIKKLRQLENRQFGFIVMMFVFVSALIHGGETSSGTSQNESPPETIATKPVQGSDQKNEQQPAVPAVIEKEEINEALKTINEQLKVLVGNIQKADQIAKEAQKKEKGDKDKLKRFEQAVKKYRQENVLLKKTNKTIESLGLEKIIKPGATGSASEKDKQSRVIEALNLAEEAKEKAKQEAEQAKRMLLVQAQKVKQEKEAFALQKNIAEKSTAFLEQSIIFSTLLTTIKPFITTYMHNPSIEEREKQTRALEYTKKIMNGRTVLEGLEKELALLKQQLEQKQLQAEQVEQYAQLFPSEEVYKAIQLLLLESNNLLQNLKVVLPGGRVTPLEKQDTIRSSVPRSRAGDFRG